MTQLQVELTPELKTDIDFIKSELTELKLNFQPKSPKRYLSINQLAEMLDVDKSTIHNWRKRNIIEAVQLGGRVFFEREKIEQAFIKLKR